MLRSLYGSYRVKTLVVGAVQHNNTATCQWRVFHSNFLFLTSEGIKVVE